VGSSQYTTLRCMLAVVAVKDLELDQLDVMTTFLNGEMEQRSSCANRQGIVKEGRRWSAT
jgi:hypothetical protein